LQHTQNLFYDDMLDEPIAIRAEGTAGVAITVRFESEHFLLKEDGNTQEFALLGHAGDNMALGAPPPGAQAIKFYAFKEMGQFTQKTKPNHNLCIWRDWHRDCCGNK
jgi:hypothetical protein